MKKSISVLTGIGILFLCFGIREWYLVSMAHSLHIVGEKNTAFISLRQQSFSFGNTSSDAVPIGKNSLLSYFADPTIRLKAIPIKKQYEKDGIIIQRISQNIIKGNFLGTNVWFVGDFSDEELDSVQEQAIPLGADIWILSKNKFPAFFPSPQQAILFLGERKPSKMLETFAREKEIPLLSVSQTGGVMLGFEKDEWSVRTRK